MECLWDVKIQASTHSHTQTYVQEYADTFINTDWQTASVFLFCFVPVRFCFAHCLPVNTWIHSSIFNDKAIRSQTKRLASLRHNLMDHGGPGGRLATEAASQSSKPTQRIALYCVVVRLIGCCGAHTQTRWHARTFTVAHTYKQRHLSPEKSQCQVSRLGLWTALYCC